MSAIQRLSFVSLLVALIQGDDAKVKAGKIQKRAKSALNAEVAMKQAELIELEEMVESAQEGFKAALANKGELIQNNKEYLRNLAVAKEKLDSTAKNVEKAKEILEFLKEQLEAVKA